MTPVLIDHIAVNLAWLIFAWWFCRYLFQAAGGDE